MASKEEIKEKIREKITKFMSSEKTKNVTKWLAFNIVFALLPLFMSLTGIIGKYNTAPTLTSVLQRGELLLISAAIAAESIGEAALSKTMNDFFKILFISSSGALLIINSAWFSNISSIYTNTITPEEIIKLANTTNGPSSIASGSISIFFVTIASGFICKIYSTS